MKITIMSGPPGTGKTSLFKNFISFLNESESSKFFEDGLVKGYKWEKQKAIVWGIYEDNEVFSGTDKFSMACQPVAIEWIKNHKDEDINIFLEGDRLSTPSFMKFIFQEMKDNYYFLLLTVSEEEKQKRYKERNSNQSEKFLRGRITKYNNLKEEFPMIELRNESPEDGQKNLEILKNILLNKYVPENTPKKRVKLF